MAVSTAAPSGPGLEVLLRLRDEAGNSVAPGEFMRAAERYRLMPHVDRWVVQTSLAALGRGGVRLAPGRSLCINLSGQTLADAGFLEFVVDCLDRTGVAPERVCFEVTENSVITNIEHARRFIGVLHGMGCRFALDDFGRGLSSFANLKNLSLDYLKIDGSFIRNLGSDNVNQAMVEGDDQAGALAEFPGDRRAGRGHQRARRRPPHGRRFRAGISGRPPAAPGHGLSAELAYCGQSCWVAGPAGVESGGVPVSDKGN